MSTAFQEKQPIVNRKRLTVTLGEGLSAESCQTLGMRSRLEGLFVRKLRFKKTRKCVTIGATIVYHKYLFSCDLRHFNGVSKNDDFSCRLYAKD